ncbi:MAG TPA: NAD(P)-dependent oxidoreductase [Gemmatimonadaceae bacterium]|nr:NAD(P)-dependent oxidoreductase [Gemmatimonadaceae bacterium]
MSDCPRGLDELAGRLSDPGDAVVRALTACPGDIIVLGAGGKMGPTLTRMAARAALAVGDGRRVIAVSRFTSPDAARELECAGVTCVHCDLLDADAVAALPDAPNVVFMAGQKFGTTEAPERTWAMNVTVPQLCATRFPGARIVAFSTGNVYPLVPVAGPGARESDAPGPVGDYARSCLARERVFEAAALRGARVAIIRLNYANALTYGVLTDLAVRVATGQPVALAMGYVNVIWQGDANRAALELLPCAASPALVVNVTGPERLAVRDLAIQLGRRLGREPVFTGTEAADALLSDASLMRSLVSPASVTLDTMLDWTAEWVRAGRPLLGKPTRFDVRDGRF